MERLRCARNIQTHPEFSSPGNSWETPTWTSTDCRNQMKDRTNAGLSSMKRIKDRTPCSDFTVTSLADRMHLVFRDLLAGIQYCWCLHGMFFCSVDGLLPFYLPGSSSLRDATTRERRNLLTSNWTQPRSIQIYVAVTRQCPQPPGQCGRTYVFLGCFSTLVTVN